MIGILCFVGIRYAQFIYKYTNILDAEQIDYEVVYWNREGDEVPEKENWIAYEKRVNTFQPFYKKISHFIGFTSFMKKTIRKRYSRFGFSMYLNTQYKSPPIVQSREIMFSILSNDIFFLPSVQFV